jgi:solute carrier family 25 uncoupling protein 8/9
MGSEEFKKRFTSSFFASGLAEVFTMPIDTVKVRLQVQKSGAQSGVVYRGMFDAVVKISRNEGVSGLFKGLVPSLLRQTSYTSISMVLFPPIKDLLGASGSDPGFLRRLLAGGTAGALGIALMNPTEVLKTQMQSNTLTRRLRMGEVVSQIWAREGILGFWSGVKPNIARTFLVNAAELGTYDHAKHMISELNIFPEGSLALHVSASGIAGVFSALTSTPADVIKTRLMNQAGQSHEYQGMFQAMVAIPRKEGVLSLYKGFTPILFRKVIWCTLFFVAFERLMVYQS